MTKGRIINRSESLLVLNDHCGQEVEITIELEHRAGEMIVAMTAKGVLRHWRDEDQLAWASHRREDIEGLYHVGDASIDVTYLGEAQALTTLSDAAEEVGVEFVLSGSTRMTVVWGPSDG